MGWGSMGLYVVPVGLRGVIWGPCGALCRRQGSLWIPVALCGSPMGRCGSLWDLCPISHHALHSRWFQARDLMLMSHLQDNIHHADPPVQVGSYGDPMG